MGFNSVFKGLNLWINDVEGMKLAVLSHAMGT
jgi:hypothetical protein